MFPENWPTSYHPISPQVAPPFFSFLQLWISLLSLSQISGLWLLFRLYLPLFLNISSLATLDQGLITTTTW